MRERLTQIPFFFFVSILPGSRCAEDDFWTVHWRAALLPLLGAALGCAADHSSLGHLHQWWVCYRSAPGDWGLGISGESFVELELCGFDKLIFNGCCQGEVLLPGAQEQLPWEVTKSRNAWTRLSGKSWDCWGVLCGARSWTDDPGGGPFQLRLFWDSAKPESNSSPFHHHQNILSWKGPTGIIKTHSWFSSNCFSKEIILQRKTTSWK